MHGVVRGSFVCSTQSTYRSSASIPKHGSLFALNLAECVLSVFQPCENVRFEKWVLLLSGLLFDTNISPGHERVREPNTTLENEQKGEVVLYGA